MTNRRKNIIIILLPFIAIILIWYLVTRNGLVQSYFLPSPISVAKAGYLLFVNNNFSNDILYSLARIFLGFTAGVILAIPLGLLIGSNKSIELFLEPVIDFVRYTPIPAFVPLLILWLGIGETEKIVIISASVFFQLVLMIANSVSQVPGDMIQFGRTLGLNRLNVVSRVVLPYSWPRIVDDMRVSLGWAWSSLLIAEIVGSTSGIGFVIIQSQRLLKTENVIFAIIIVGLLGISFDQLFKVSRKLLFPWFRKSVI
ncbi:MAG: ABC transporter permease [Patescibacteria group bacterium]